MTFVTVGVFILLHFEVYQIPVRSETITVYKIN